MSAVIKTITPFINKTLLLQALDNIGCKYVVQNGDIITDRKDYYGLQKFSLLNGRYNFVHDSSAVENSKYPWGNIGKQGHKPVREFLLSLESEYKSLYAKELEEQEKERLEKERQEFVEKQRASIVEKAKEQGYFVKQENINGKIKLVLIKNTY